jgi:hypothetical protein
LNDLAAMMLDDFSNGEATEIDAYTPAAG